MKADHICGIGLRSLDVAGRIDTQPVRRVVIVIMLRVSRMNQPACSNSTCEVAGTQRASNTSTATVRRRITTYSLPVNLLSSFP